MILLIVNSFLQTLFVCDTTTVVINDEETGASVLSVTLQPTRSTMAKPEEPFSRIFSLSEATELLPKLGMHLTRAKAGKTILLQTKEEIKKASANAQYGGGSCEGPRYIKALETIYENLNKIHEMGVIVKDLEIGLCDFPYLMEGRVVYLCWRLGEETIEWWHEIDDGYKGRQALPKGLS